MSNARTRTISSDPLLVAVQARREIEARDAVATLTAVLDWSVANTADEVEDLVGAALDAAFEGGQRVAVLLSQRLIGRKNWVQK